MQNARLGEAQAGIKISGRNINNLRYADDSTLMAGSKEELKTFLMKVKEESEKVGLKLFFFNCSKRGLLFSCSVWASHCDGFSCCRAQALEHAGFSSCGVGRSVVVAHMLCGMWYPPRPWNKPMSPALAGIFLTTRPLRKSNLHLFLTVYLPFYC